MKKKWENKIAIFYIKSYIHSNINKLFTINKKLLFDKKNNFSINWKKSILPKKIKKTLVIKSPNEFKHSRELFKQTIHKGVFWYYIKYNKKMELDKKNIKLSMLWHKIMYYINIQKFTNYIMYFNTLNSSLGMHNKVILNYKCNYINIYNNLLHTELTDNFAKQNFELKDYIVQKEFALLKQLYVNADYLLHNTKNANVTKLKKKIHNKLAKNWNWLFISSYYKKSNIRTIFKKTQFNLQNTIKKKINKNYEYFFQRNKNTYNINYLVDKKLLKEKIPNLTKKNIIKKEYNYIEKNKIIKYIKNISTEQKNSKNSLNYYLLVKTHNKAS
jgi:ribosomal protein S10